MADEKVSALAEITEFDGDEYVYVVDDPSGTPVGKKAQVGNLPPGPEFLPRLHSPSGLRRWTAALADSLFGLADVLCLGDSITLGAYSNDVAVSDDASWRTSGWVAQYRTLLATTFGATGEGIIKLAEDVRVTFSGGSASSTVGPLQTGRQFGSGNTITFTPDGTTGNFTGFEFYYLNSGGSFSYAVDGGGATTVTPAGGDTIGSVSVTGLSEATHTIVLTGVSGTAHVGYLLLKRGTTGVRVHRVGKSGATTETATMNTGSAANRTRMLAATFAINPDLAVFMFGANDIPNQGTNSITPTVFRANLKTLTDAVATRGGCSLLLAGPRYPNASSPYTEDDYYAEMLDLAQTDDHVAYADLSEVWGTEADAETLGFMSYSALGIHPKRKGHGSICRVVEHLTIRRLVGV